MASQAIFHSDAFGTQQVVQLRGREAMNELSRFEVVIDAADPDIALEDVLGDTAVVAFGDADGFSRTMSLIIIDAAYAGPTRDGHRYDIVLSASSWLSTQRIGYRIFQQLGVNEIVQQVLLDAGMVEDSIHWRLAEPLHARDQCVQYAESEWAFVERLLADEGISYWFDGDDDGHSVVVFGDTASGYDPIAGGGTLRYDDAGGMSTSASSLFSFERTLRMCPQAAHVSDYDVERPDVPIDGRAGGGPLEYYEYPAWVPAEGATHRAQVRLEQLQRLSDSARVQSHSARLQPGRVLEVDGIADDEHNGRYLVVAVEHALTQPKDGSAAQHYVAEAVVVPHDDQHCHRPAVPHEVPRIDGFESAQVTGAAGEEIHVDHLGCVKLRVPWDRSGIDDDKSSRWARSMQLNMDGSMMLPRVGWEVGVAYRDGRPDMPLVLAKLYNATANVPYPLPENKATASWMSGTTPGGGSVNEVRMVDDAGKQEFAVQASADQGVVVGGNLTTKVDVDEKYNVKGNVNTSIDGAQTVVVGAVQEITVGSGCLTKVAGTRTVLVGGMEEIGVDLNRTLDCGATYCEAVGGLYFIRCNNHNETLKADFAQTVGGLLLISGLGGVNEQVVGTRNEVCCGPRVISAAQCENKAYGAMALTCGASTFTAADEITTTVKSSAAVNAAAVTLKGGAGVVLGGGATVSVTAASLSCGGYKMAGSHSLSGWIVLLGNSTAEFNETKAKS